jgi:hypothetical protein
VKVDWGKEFSFVNLFYKFYKNYTENWFMMSQVNSSSNQLASN